MDNTNSNQEIWKLNSQQHVSLDKHNRMIQDAVQWQRGSTPAKNGNGSIVKTLRTRIGDMLSFVTRPANSTEARATQEAKAT